MARGSNTYEMISTSDLSFKPFPGAQERFLASPVDEILFGGQAGPGKSLCLMMAPLRYIEYPDFRAIIIRRTFPQLREIIDRAFRWYPLFGGIYRGQDHTWRFPSGCSIVLGHLQHEQSVHNYQGIEFSMICIDEVTQLIPYQYLYMFSRLRTTNPDIKPQMLTTSNPGGIGHSFIKERYRIGLVKPETIIKDRNTGMTRTFIPAKLSDNPAIMENDPLYVERLRQLPEILQKQLLEGDWNCHSSTGFPELSYEIHGYEGALPQEWTRIAAFDWGYSKPAAYIVAAVDFDGVIWIEDMLYLARKNDAGFLEGLKLTDQQLGDLIKEFEGRIPGRISDRIIDPSCMGGNRGFHDGIKGPGVAESLGNQGIYFRKGDNRRVEGRQQLHHRLLPDPETGKPYLRINRKLADLWRTLENLEENPKKPEDIFSDSRTTEDDAYDALRYLIMSRPFTPKRKSLVKKGTLEYEKQKYQEARNYAKRHGTTIAKGYEKVRRRR